MSTPPFSTPGAPSTAPGSTVLQRAYPQLTGLSIQDLQPILNKMCDWIFQLATQIGSPITTTGSTATITALHADRINRFPATAQNVGDRFIETDRGEVEYAVGSVGAVKTWLFIGGTYANTLANRPTDLGTNDSGFVFFATDTTDLYRWSGSAWIYFGGALAAQDFKPVTDQGASLGSNLLRFLNLFLKGQLATGMAGALTTAPAILADLRNASANGALLHLENSDDLDGMYMVSDNNKECVWAKGAYFDGTNWIATSDTAILVQLTKLGTGVRVFYNSGLTPGFSIALTLIFKIDNTGSITTCNAITASGTVQAPTVNATSGFQANGTAGTTGTMNIPAATSPGSITIKEGIITAFTNPVGN